MKSIKYSLLVVAFLFLNTGLCHAHALYIDTNAQATPGKKQEVRVYYSELKERTLEKLPDWYSDVADFKLWLVQPDGSRVQLQTTAKEDHFSASFVPEKQGAYRLEISHMAEDPGEQTAYQFNAFAQVRAGVGAEPLSLTDNSPELVLVEEKTTGGNTKTKKFKTYFKGEPKEGISATLFLPSGKTETVKSNSEGVFQIDLQERGTYFLEATTWHEDEAVKTKKAPYQSVWRCATQKIEL